MSWLKIGQKHSTLHCYHSRKTFYLWVNNIFNRVDEERKKIVGSERVAAEWILRCGGGVKFSKINRYIWDYNNIPDWPKTQYEVEGIDASGTYITDSGLDHLDGLEHLICLNLSNCRYVSDLNKLLPVKGTLKELNISNCSEVRDLSALFNLKQLKCLVLSGLISVKDKDSTILHLNKRLTACKIMDDVDIKDKS